MERRDTQDQAIKFFINGNEHKVSHKFSATTSLNDYLREVAGLKGTKVMCREAGCGCCSVAVTHVIPDYGKLETYSMQSCLMPLYAVDGWQISTVEGIGNQKNGFHPIQERIASFNGTQCGYCTPGMVMNMYGLLHQKPNITAQEIEDNFDGNICRCTGYRSILDAMKSFAEDANIPGAKTIDIEDLNKNLCPRTGELCSGNHSCTEQTHDLSLQINEVQWHRPTSLSDLGCLLKTNINKKVKMFFGNTASGIFKNQGPFDVYIDLHNVKEIYSFQIGTDSVRFGAATSLTNFMSRLKENQEKTGFKYFSACHRHLKFVANVMVRNAGCIAGNLMIKHAHPDFPSDIFTILESLGAKLELYDCLTEKSANFSLLDFLKIDMTGKVILSVELPKLTDNEVFKSFKITPRWQNAHAYVNAAFRVKTDNRTIQDQPSIVYGGINSETVHAVKTEEFLSHKTLSDTVVKEALTILKGELNVECDQLHSSPKYRQELSVTLLYKVLLGIYNPDNVKLRSGTEYLHRPISSGLQTYQEMKSEWPLKKAMPKKTAPLQASGEAQFVNDIPTFQHELFAAYVLADVSAATLESIDASEALKIPGVVTFVSAKDIPDGGTNNYMVSSGMFQLQPQELFATKDIAFSGQPVGMILAETQSLANMAAKKVKVNVCDVRQPILSLEESIAQGKEYDPPMTEFVVGTPDEIWSIVDKTLEGECSMGSQYHFYMETQVSLAVPSEDGIDLYASAQFPEMNQHVAAEIIGKPMNFINVTVPRLGGGFGGKVFDSSAVSAAASLGAYLTGRPVRMSLDMATNMQVCGKRAPILAKYKIGFSNSGDVQVIDMDYYSDIGCTSTRKGEITHAMHYMDMCYHVPHWKIRPHAMMTNKQTMTATRAPGAVPAAFVIETIMEHVAKVVNKHPIVVKEINLYEKHHKDHYGHDMKDCTIRELWRRLKDTADVDGRMRQVDVFNQENLWKKRGITMTTNKYGMMYFGTGHSAYVSIYARDGSVAVSQGGVEMGQGLYTKVAQGVAHALGVPIDNIKVRSNQNIITPNNTVSGGSVASECAMQAAIEASNILKERMRPIREKFPDADWKELCLKSVENKIDLSAKYTFTAAPAKPHFHYFTYCAAVIETEVDILTGESQIRRVDIMADFGESLNPTIDIGQIEGAFVMGLGCYLSEDIIFDSQTGRILNDGTWEYKPPTTKDIPIDWRIYLLPDTPNPSGIRSSKATGEPPISLSVGALLANKLAIQSARKDLFGFNDFMPTVAPYTVERAQQSVGLSVDNLTL
uniref:FAD-binding PCMH-type domain-containing protein n=1 Tax=Arion vulgaris TaxID=1028688 RepID=A0A0B7B2H5_9EUPU